MLHVYHYRNSQLCRRCRRPLDRGRTRAVFCLAGCQPHCRRSIPGSGGCRKVRWALQGTGKRGGVRVIYFVRNTNQTLWLLVIYAKSVRGNIPAHLLKQIREVLEHEQE